MTTISIQGLKDRPIEPAMDLSVIPGPSKHNPVILSEQSPAVESQQAYRSAVVITALAGSQYTKNAEYSETLIHDYVE